MAANRSTKRGAARRSRDTPAPDARPDERVGLPISMGDGVFRPLKTAEAFARDLVREIVSRGLQTGDKLPSEAAMLEQFGISRESLREGLRLLEVQGLITLRRGPGGGPIVGHLDPAHLGRTSSMYYHLAGGTYAELLEAWVTLEPILADRAARNPDRDAVRAAMAPYLSVPDEHDDEAFAEFVTSHARFHQVVASLAGNRVLELTLQAVGQIAAHHIIGHADPRQDREVIEADHRAIAEAVLAGQPRKAAAACEAHVRTLIEVFEADLGEQLHQHIDWR